MSSVYNINKGVNKSIEFRGLKAQYIWWLAGGMVADLVLFAVMYIAGLNSYVCVVIALLVGGAVFVGVGRMSSKYGEFGMMKWIAKRSIPKAIVSRSRKIFIKEFQKPL